ncbi:MAG TPA: hypothetical protein VJQ53_07855 [Candidatus Eisenbacteria bacterium]|nr:hypothetical protein [Candidatus Eisenbacteria bacterium]
MRSHSCIDARAARALPWLAALIAVAVFGVSGAGAADEPAKPAGATTPATKAAEPAAKPSRPPISPAAVKQATELPSQQKTDAAPAPSSQAAPDSGMTLRGGQERTDFRTMTVEGEDRVHLDIDRPALTLDLDPEKVGGLESGTASDVLNRVPPDLLTGFLGTSAHIPSPYLAHPWLSQFATGPVARFQPNVKDVDRWKLMVADSKGQTVKTFQGKGDPPKEIAWDGRSQDGTSVTPGLTYSYIFEAYDKAGNKRNFVGEGFRVSAYRLDSPDGPVLVFSGQSVLAALKSARAFGLGADGTSKVVPPVILEAAGWLNASSRLTQPLRITATARSYEQASFLAGRVNAALTEIALGDPARIQAVTEVVSDAPDGGTIRIGPPSGESTPSSAPPASAPPLNSRDSRSKSKAR